METSWIRDGLRQAGRSQADLARALGLTPPQVTRILAGARRIKADEVNKIREFLGLEPISLTGSQQGAGDAGPHGPLPRPPIPEALPQAAPAGFGGRDLPIFGKAQCGPDGYVTFPQGAVDWYARPPELAGVRDAFAVFAEGDSMGIVAPAGSVVLIHPHKGVRPGDLCLILRRDEGAFLKAFVGRKRGKVVVEQINPPQQIEWPEEEIQAMYLVIGVMRR